jgi:hypothetical protein
MIAPSLVDKNEYARRLRPPCRCPALFVPDIFLVYSWFYSLPPKGGGIIVQASEGVQAANTDAVVGARLTGSKRAPKLTLPLTTQLWRPRKAACMGLSP